MTKEGREWFYRLIANPQRASHQKALPVFAWKVIKQKVTSRRIED